MASEKTMDWADGIAFYLDVGCGHATEEAVRGDIADMLRQTRNKALEEAAKVADRTSGNTKDFNSDYRRGAGGAASAIRALAPSGEGEGK